MKCMLTVLGQDKPGIIAKVSTLLAAHNINIMDISQTILQDMFTMIMLVDISSGDISFLDLSKELNTIGETIGVSIHLQHKDVFDAMHKI